MPTDRAQEASRRAENWQVWFSKAGLSLPQRDGRWVFAEAAGAYAAVHVVRGEFALPENPREKLGRWLVCEDQTSPVIVEVTPKNAYPDFAAFRRAVLGRPISLTGEQLAYTSLKGDEFTFFLDQRAPPLINQRPANLEPRNVIESPFIQSAWNSGIVTLQKGDRRQTLDFTR